MAPSSTRRDLLLKFLSLALVGLSLLTKLAGMVWLNGYSSPEDAREYSEPLYNFEAVSAHHKT